MILAAGGWFVVTWTPWAQYELLVYAVTASAGLVLSAALLRGRLVPRPLAGLGMVGCAALLVGVVLDAVGMLSLDSAAGGAFFAPGAVFEIALPVWLLARGFAPPAPGTAPSVPREAVRSS